MHDRGLAGAILALLCFLTLIVSCASPPQAAPVPEGGEVSIPMPENTSRSFFASINRNTLALVEDGSPSSIQKAYSALHRSSSEDYDENEKVLIKICSEIMSIVWPSQKASFEAPGVGLDNTYVGALDSVRRGIYDSSTGNVDFLARVIPSMVLLTADSSKTDYYPLAYEALSGALRERPESVLANYLFGTLLLRQGDAQQSLERFTVAREYSGALFEVDYAQGLAYHKIGRDEEALGVGEALLASYPQSIEALTLCSEASYALGQLDKAEEYVLRVLQLEPENLVYVLFRARILLDKKDFIRASSLLDVYARSNTSSRDYLLLKATLQRDWNRNLTAAGETIAQALSLYPDDSEILLFAAQIASSSRTTIGGLSALEMVRKVLAVDPQNETAMLIEVEGLMGEKQWQEAYAISYSIVSSGKATTELFYNHVEICIATGRSQEAATIARRLYDSNPGDETVQQMYVRVLVATGEKDLARQTITALLPSANSRMKSFLYYQRSFIAATEDASFSDLRSSLTANPRNTDALYRLYELYYAKKDWRRAQYYLKQVVALNPSDSDILKKNAELDQLLSK